MTTYAVIGGTFDPVHNGHISLAEDVLRQTDTDIVVFMPAKLQPFKLDVKVSSFEDRFEMLMIAFGGREDMTASTLENELDGVSYTYRTLDEFRSRIGEDDRLYFVTGSDTFTKLDTWTEPEHLLRTNSFIIGVRPGYPVDELEEKREEYSAKYGTVSKVIDNEKHDISSTMIRERAAAGEPIDGLVPAGVKEYITAKGLYR